MVLLFSCDSLATQSEEEPQVFLATFQYESSPWPDGMVLNDAAVSTVSNENITSYAASYSDAWKTGVYEGKEYMTCFRYNVGLTVPVDAKVIKAVLKFPSALIYDDDTDTPIDLRLYGMNSNWSVEYANWNFIMSIINTDMQVGYKALYDDDATELRYISVDIPVDPTYVQSWLNGPNYGMVLRAENVDATENYLSYFGNNYTNPYMRPMLMVYYTL